MVQGDRHLVGLESRGLLMLMFLLLPIIIHSIMSRYYLRVEIMVRVPESPLVGCKYLFVYKGGTDFSYNNKRERSLREADIE